MEGSNKEDILHFAWIKWQCDLKYKLAHCIKELIKNIVVVPYRG